MELSQGFVGQVQAREALGLHLSLLKMGRHSGRPLLLVGPPGTGKVSKMSHRAVRRCERLLSHRAVGELYPMDWVDGSYTDN